MLKKYALFLFAFAFIIPNLDWRIWLSCFPELNAIVKCESNYNPSAKHINKNGTTDRGLFQINVIHKVDFDSYDPYQSLAWAIQKYYDGDLDIWVCHDKITKGKIKNL